ncbi:homologous recombination mediator [Vibrio phage vB_VpM-pA2SJ1]|uniref:Homologous recombination mediator n=1 Tax=Vibrio phage vB_VpM-pA2SJ1 TaxID=3095964 RepID=A0AAX4J5W8_9CAUD
MSKEIVMIKIGPEKWIPATEADIEICKNYAVGSPVKCEFTQWTPRSLRHHKLYWGGLLKLAMDYWEPKGGLISPAEKQVLNNVITWIESNNADSEAMKGVFKAFLEDTRQSRQQRIEPPEKSIQELHNWVKRKAGYYDLVMTPEGMEKRVKSINFNAMDQHQFNEFYRKAFSVVWRYILSRNFSNEAEAETAVNKLIGMGN